MKTFNILLFTFIFVFQCMFLYSINGSTSVENYNLPVFEITSANEQVIKNQTMTVASKNHLIEDTSIMNDPSIIVVVNGMVCFL